MNLRIRVALLLMAAPLAALAGVKCGLLPRTTAVPHWYLLLAAPFWEEALFRRGLQYRLLAYLWTEQPLLGLSRANWLTSFCFAAVHIPWQGAASVAILIPSLALGWLFERTNLLFPCVLLHAWFNLSWLLVSRYCGV